MKGSFGPMKTEAAFLGSAPRYGGNRTPARHARGALRLCVPILCVLVGASIERDTAAQVTPCCCWEQEITSACAVVDGVPGVNCGSYSCPHRIVINEQHRRCIPASSGLSDCEPLEDPASTCRMQLAACSPPHGCVMTVVIQTIYIVQSGPTGDRCGG